MLRPVVAALQRPVSMVSSSMVSMVRPFRGMSATAGKPIQCRAAIAWEKAKGSYPTPTLHLRLRLHLPTPLHLHLPSTPFLPFIACFYFC
jgi:hypothetical protein